MQAVAKSRWVGQLKLFDPTIVAPTWERMPREIRGQTIRLLAQLLRQHWASERQGTQPREARDE